MPWTTIAVAIIVCLGFVADKAARLEASVENK